MRARVVVCSAADLAKDPAFMRFACLQPKHDIEPDENHAAVGGEPRDSLRRCTATISARIEIAISSGVIAPRSRPAGALSLASRSRGISRAASSAFKDSAFFRLPTKAT